MPLNQQSRRCGYQTFDQGPGRAELEGEAAQRTRVEFQESKQAHQIRQQQIANRTFYSEPLHGLSLSTMRPRRLELLTLVLILHGIQLVVSGSLSETFMISCLLLTATLEIESQVFSSLEKEIRSITRSKELRMSRQISSTLREQKRMRGRLKLCKLTQSRGFIPYRKRGTSSQ